MSFSADEYLAHHGIKGQRWGVRRFRERDGDLTAAGQQRYGVGNGRKKSQHRINLEEKYRKAGMSKEDAEQKANKRINVEKGVAIGAAASAGVAAIALYRKYGKNAVNKHSDLQVNSLLSFNQRDKNGERLFTPEQAAMAKKAVKKVFQEDRDLIFDWFSISGLDDD